VIRDEVSVFAINITVPKAKTLRKFDADFLLGDFPAQDLRNVGIYDIIVKTDGRQILQFKYVSSLPFDSDVESDMPA
jgi:hypothetical protein